MRRLIFLGLAALALAGATIPAAKAGGFEDRPFGSSRYEHPVSDFPDGRIAPRFDGEPGGFDRGWHHRRPDFERHGYERHGYQRHAWGDRHAWGPGYGYGPRCIVKIDRVWTGYGWEVDRRRICR